MRTDQGHVDVARFENRGLHDEIPKLAPTDATEYLTMVTRAQSAFFTSFYTAAEHPPFTRVWLALYRWAVPVPVPKHDVSVMHPTSGLVRNSKPMTEDRRQKHLVQPLRICGHWKRIIESFHRVTEPRNENPNFIVLLTSLWATNTTKTTKHNIVTSSHLEVASRVI